MDIDFFKRDIQYVLLNCFVSKIPSWHIRRFFYRLCGMSIHKTARIGINTIIVSPKGIKIGKRSVVNSNCFIDGSGKVLIGKDVSISAFTKIFSCTHKTDSEIFEYTTNPVVINDNVWIGAGSIILDDSIIDEFSVIGAGCCFKGITEKGYIYYGNPAKKIKKRKLKRRYAIDFNPHFR